MKGEMHAAPEVSGRCDDRFGAVKEELGSQLAAGEELGAAITVDIGGTSVVDVWGGHRDVDRREPWQEDTIVDVWSTTKMITSLAALMLVDRGLVDPFAPVADYWPDFAQSGKERVEVRHLMSHNSGVSGWEQPFEVEDIFDWELSTSRLAAQAPWWEPGTGSGYHANNQGHLVGEVLRRVTGKSLKQFVAEEISAPLGADFQIGALERDWDRIVPIVPPPPLEIDIDELDQEGPAYKTLSGPPVDATVANTEGWRRADIGASNGHGNARGVARIMRVLALGGSVDGLRLLGPETIDLIFQEQSHGTDLVLGIPLRFGIGYALPEDETVPYVPSGRSCYWGGWGGSLTIVDLDRELTFSYVMNKMAPGIIGSDRSAAYFRALERCLA